MFLLTQDFSIAIQLLSNGDCLAWRTDNGIA